MIRVYVLTEEEIVPFRHSVNQLLDLCFGSHQAAQYLWFIVTQWNHSAQQNQLIACAAVDPLQNKLWNVCVAPTHRKQGVAALLMKEVVDKFPTVSLYVHRDNRSARRLYIRMGFVEDWKNSQTVCMTHF